MLYLIVGSLAVVFTVVSYYQTDKTLFLKYNIVAASTFAGAMYMDHAYTGAILASFSTIMYIFALLISERVRKISIYIIPPLAFSVSYLSLESQYLPDISYSHIIPYIPSIGGLFVSLATFQKNMIFNKIFLFIGILLWTIYGFLMSSWLPMLADLLGLVAIGFSMLKLMRVSNNS